jgi:hypothetical protein
MMARPENHGRAVQYLRRSVERDKSADQDKGAGQRAANAQQAARDSVTISRTFDGDWGTSGGRGHREARHAMADLIDAIRAGEVSRVYCHTTDRLARDVEYGMALWNACKDAGTILRPGSQTFDPSEPGYLTLWTVLLAQAEEDLDRMTRKNTDNADYRRAHALTCPFPGRPHPGRCHLVGCTDKTHCTLSHETGRKNYGADPAHPAEDVAAVLAAFDRAGSFLGASNLLTEAHVPTRLGRPEWDLRTVARIVRRARPEMPHPPSECPLRPARGEAGHDSYQCPHGGGARKGARARATRPLAGLLRCGGRAEDGTTCGHILTSAPRPAGHSTVWLCRKGRTARASHGRYMISEGRILPAIQAELAHYQAPGTEYEAARSAQVDDLRATLARIQRLAVNGTLSEDDAAEEARTIRGQLAALDAKAGPVAIPQAISWTAPAAELNAWLRAVLPGGIRLGADLLPVAYGWLPGWRAD